MAKSWQEKMNSPHSPHVVVLEKPMWGQPAGARVFVTHPSQVKAYIDKIPSGKSKTIPEMRATLAKRNHADETCPLTTGILVRIVAEAALEELRTGRKLSEITPFWRIMDEKSPTAKKLNGGAEFIAKQRKAEGI